MCVHAAQYIMVSPDKYRTHFNRRQSTITKTCPAGVHDSPGTPISVYEGWRVIHRSCPNFSSPSNNYDLIILIAHIPPPLNLPLWNCPLWSRYQIKLQNVRFCQITSIQQRLSFRFKEFSSSSSVEPWQISRWLISENIWSKVDWKGL